MSLETPEKIRKLQKKLYSKAKEERAYRFYLLYDKIYREDILAHSWELVKANGGAAGVDGVNFEQIESEGIEKWLDGIRTDLRNRTYEPKPVRRVMIPKAGGGERPLGIPTIRDRVVQTATKMVIEPIFEADLEPEAYGYRPKRSAQDAIEKVHQQPQNVGSWPVVRERLNRTLRGWSNYFSYGTRAKAYQSVDRYVYERVRQFLRRRHKVSSRATTRFTIDDVFGSLGVIRLRRVQQRGGLS